MEQIVAAQIMKWSSTVSDVDYNRIAEIIEYRSQKQFSKYEMFQGPSPDFDIRLRNWLRNLKGDEEGQKLLFQLVPSIFYISAEEFWSLYRSALRGPILKWLVDICPIDVTHADVQTTMASEISRTWFCPITDSMQIPTFCHCNQLSGVNDKPQWRPLAKIGSPSENAKGLLKYMHVQGLERVVLLEDFVGSGSQMKDLKPILSEMAPNVPILIVPLINCPAGVKSGRDLEALHKNIRVESVLELSRGGFINDDELPDNTPYFMATRTLLNRCHNQVAGAGWSLTRKPFGPYGFKKTGALIVMQSNTPNNTIPLIHHDSTGWNALFPRASRL